MSLFKQIQQILNEDFATEVPAPVASSAQPKRRLLLQRAIDVAKEKISKEVERSVGVVKKGLDENLLNKDLSFAVFTPFSKKPVRVRGQIKKFIVEWNGKKLSVFALIDSDTISGTKGRFVEIAPNEPMEMF